MSRVLSTSNGMPVSDSNPLPVKMSGGAGGAGSDGKSAYEIAVNNGFEGNETDWLVSLKGAKGASGSNGRNGLDGSKILFGGDVPNDSLGENGDLFINYGTADAYFKEGESWGFMIRLKGERGTDGTNGNDAEPQFTQAQVDALLALIEVGGD